MRGGGRTVVLLDSQHALQIAEGILSGVTLGAGNEYFFNDFGARSRMQFHSSISLFLRIGTSGDWQLPLTIPLTEKNNELRLSLVTDNLALLTNNRRAAVYLAKLDGVFQIPPASNGALVFQLIYEKVFPAFAALKALTTLDLRNYTANIGDWKNLGGARDLRRFRIEGHPKEIGPYVPLSCRHLVLADKVLDLFPEDCLEKVQSLQIDSPTPASLRRIFSLQNLQWLRTRVTAELPDPQNEKTLLQLTANLAASLSTSFPERLQKLGEQRTATTGMDT